VSFCVRPEAGFACGLNSTLLDLSALLLEDGRPPVCKNNTGEQSLLVYYSFTFFRIVFSFDFNLTTVFITIPT